MILVQSDRLQSAAQRKKEDGRCEEQTDILMELAKLTRCLCLHDATIAERIGSASGGSERARPPDPLRESRLSYDMRVVKTSAVCL